MADNDNLSVDQLSRLLRLYLDWPDKIDQDPDQEANAFYLWLAEELDEEDLAETTSGLDGVKLFIKSHPVVLSGARQLGGGEGETADDSRDGIRVSVNTQLFFLVYDCAKEPELEGTILRGIMLDMARNGIRVETRTPIPPGSIVSMTVAQVGTAVTLYNLTGEVRWLTENAESNHLGISIFNIEDHQEWQDFYLAMSLNS